MTCMFKVWVLAELVPKSSREWMISTRTSKLSSSRLEVHHAVLLTFVSSCFFTVCLVCFRSYYLLMLLVCYFGFCFVQLSLSAQASTCYVESSSSLWVASLVHCNTPKNFNALCGIDVVRLWVSHSSRSGVSLRFQLSVALKRSLAVGTILHWFYMTLCMLVHEKSLMLSLYYLF